MWCEKASNPSSARRLWVDVSQSTPQRLRFACGDKHAHGQSPFPHLARDRAARRTHRLRARSICLLRPTREPCRLVRHVRTHRLLLFGRHLALRQRTLPVADGFMRHRRPLLARPATPALLSSHAPVRRSSANRVDCNGFSNRAQDAGSMISTPFWPEAIRTRCVVLQGGPSRACSAGDSSGRNSAVAVHRPVVPKGEICNSA
jgi:hypothetical protein